MESSKPHNTNKTSATQLYYPTTLTQKPKPSLQIVNKLSAPKAARDPSQGLKFETLNYKKTKDLKAQQNQTKEKRKTETQKHTCGRRTTASSLQRREEFESERKRERRSKVKNQEL